MTENEIARVVVDTAYVVYKALGPGLLESAYGAVLSYELRKRGLQVERERSVPLIYESVKLDVGYRLDLLVGGSVVVEIKSLEVVAPVHKKQVLTYLRLSGKRLGLLINFGAPSFRLAVTRLVKGLPE